MILRYKTSKGTLVEFALQDKPLTIGRSPKADIILDDEKSSRLHCGIRLLDDEYVVKDLASKNGTYLNDERIESAELHVGDKIRVGNITMSVEDKPSQGATSAFHEMEQRFSGGKGYDTILKEIVNEANPPKKEDK